jgi:5-methylcytosine-specific restriction protein A
MTDYHYTFFSDVSHRKKEKNKARNIKKMRWWQQKCAERKCYYCKEIFSYEELTVDHIVPLARGGTTTPGNVVPACLSCNKNKGMDTPVDLYFKSQETL